MVDDKQAHAADRQVTPQGNLESECEAPADEISTDPVLQRELDTLESILRSPPADDDPQFLNESGCQRVVELVAAIGRDPSVVPGEAAVSADAAQAPPMERLGQYKLLAKLGEGGMGAVYKALHTRLQKVVALKVLPADKLKDEDAVARFDREMRAAGQLNHPNIIAAHDAGEVDGNHYLVMELVDGSDVSALVKGFQEAVQTEHGTAENGTGSDQDDRCLSQFPAAGLPIPEACEIIRQAAEGLQHAHEHGMVHRDIKPSNIMLQTAGGIASPMASGGRKPTVPSTVDPATRQPAGAAHSPEPVVKILDMGLALFDDRHQGAKDLTGTGQMMGTIDYMAPEQGGDSHKVDIRADIYALGATLYKLLAGRAPFADEKYDAVINKLMALATETPTPLHDIREDIPRELSDYVSRLLSKSPDDRPATPREVAEAVTPYAEGARLGDLLQFVEQAHDTETDRTSDTFAHLSSSFTDTHRPASGGPTPRAAAGTKPAIRPWLPIAAGMAIVFIAALLAGPWLWGILFKIETPQGTITIEVPEGEENNIEVAVLKGGQDVKILDAKQGWTIHLEDGEYKLDVRKGGDRFAVSEDTVTVRSQGEMRVRVTLQKRSEAGELAGLKNEPFPATGSIEERKVWVVTQLRRRNPAYNGALEFGLEEDRIVSIGIHNAPVVDISPLKHLTDLRSVDLMGCRKLSDLSPLVELKLTSVKAHYTSVKDLSPLKRMKLTRLWVGETPTWDLSPLAGMPLTYLYVRGSKVVSLAEIKGLPLEHLNCAYTAVRDLSPVEGMPLKHLTCDHTKITDFGVLRTTSVESIDCDLEPDRDIPIFAAIATLKTINAQPVADVLARKVRGHQPATAFPGNGSADEKQSWIVTELQRLNPEYNGNAVFEVEDGRIVGLDLDPPDRPLPVNDISPLRHLVNLRSLDLHKADVSDISPIADLPIERLRLRRAMVSDLTPLRNMPLEHLDLAESRARTADWSPLAGLHLKTLNVFAQRQLKDLTPLKGMPLEELALGLTGVTDLTPLKDMPLKRLIADRTLIDDLSPLRGVSLTEIDVSKTRVTDLSPLTESPIREIVCDFDPVRDSPVMTSIRTLQTINGKATAELIAPVFRLPKGKQIVLTKQYHWNNRAKRFNDVAIAPNNEWIVVATKDHRVLLLPLRDGAEPRELAREEAFPRRVAVSSDSTMAAWTNTQGRTTVKNITREGPPQVLKQKAFGIAFSPTSSLLALGLADSGRIAIVDPADGKLLAEMTTRKPAGVAAWLTFSHDGKRIASGHDFSCLGLWDVERKTMAGRLDSTHQGDACVDLSRDGRWLAAAGDEGTVNVWDLLASDVKHVLRHGAARVVRAAFSPKSDFVVTGGADGFLRAWDTESGKEIGCTHLGVLEAMAFSPDGKLLVTAGDTTIRVWNVETVTPAHITPVPADGSFEEQQAWVITELRRLNPKIDDPGRFNIRDGKIVAFSANRLAGLTDVGPLSYLEDLQGVQLIETGVADLSPLTGLPLRVVDLSGSPVTDLTPLADCPLDSITCSLDLERDGAVLRSIETLKTINGKPAAEVLGGE